MLSRDSEKVEMSCVKRYKYWDVNGIEGSAPMTGAEIAAPGADIRLDISLTCMHPLRTLSAPAC
jgi:hypothetical protein